MILFNIIKYPASANCIMTYKEDEYVCKESVQLCISFRVRRYSLSFERNLNLNLTIDKYLVALSKS